MSLEIDKDSLNLIERYRIFLRDHLNNRGYPHFYFQSDLKEIENCVDTIVNELLYILRNAKIMIKSEEMADKKTILLAFNSIFKL